MTELRLAGAVTIEEANVVLKEFLDRFNARFGVPAQHPEAAYRPLGPGACLDTVLCFRHSRRGGCVNSGVNVIRRRPSLP